MQPRPVAIVLILRSLYPPKHARVPFIQTKAHEPVRSSRLWQLRAFHGNNIREARSGQSEPVREPTGKAPDKETSVFDDSIAQEKDKQQRAPWHREGSNLPPVARPRSAGAMTKGRAPPDWLMPPYQLNEG